jgi:ATP/maltotriose-dependent transcriptional regulator MalT
MLDMLNQGLTNNEIGERLGISPHTVKGHLLFLFKQLGVKSRMQALFKARSLGLLGQSGAAGSHVG